MTPYSVWRMSKVNASKTRLVPSHMYLQWRTSSDGRKVAAYRSRTAEFTPSPATTRS